MFFKDCTLIALLLFVIIIVFAFLSYNKQVELMSSYKEGHENMSDDDDIPTCGGGDSDPPGCYNTVLDYDIYNYDPTSNWAMDDDNYILKTQIVPPVCPSCPTSLIDHQHGEVDASGSSTGSGEFSNNVDSNNTQVTNVNDIEQTSISNNESTSTTNNNQQMSNVYNVTNNTSYGGEKEQGGNKNGGSFGSILGNGSSSSGNGKSMREYENEINRLKGEISKLKQGGNGSSSGNGECPPCPACERCPEPAFTCEKVINYRSPNVGEYLPLPVLNDFSTF